MNFNYEQIGELAQNRPAEADQTDEQRRVLIYLDNKDLPCAFAYNIPLALFIIRNVFYRQALAGGNYELFTVSCAKSNRKPFCSWRLYFRSRDPECVYDETARRIFKNIFVRVPPNASLDTCTVDTDQNNVMFFVMQLSLKKGDPVIEPTTCPCGRANFSLSLTLPHIVGVDLESEVDVKGKWKKIIFYYRSSLKMK